MVDREQVQKIRAFIRHRLETIKENRYRLRHFLALVINRYLITELWDKFSERRGAIERALRMAKAVMFIQMRYKRKLLMNGQNIQQRQLRSIK